MNLPSQAPELIWRTCGEGCASMVRDVPRRHSGHFTDSHTIPTNSDTIRTLVNSGFDQEAPVLCQWKDTTEPRVCIVTPAHCGMFVLRTGAGHEAAQIIRVVLPAQTPFHGELRRFLRRCATSELLRLRRCSTAVDDVGRISYVVAQIASAQIMHASRPLWRRNSGVKYCIRTRAVDELVVLCG